MAISVNQNGRFEELGAWLQILEWESNFQPIEIRIHQIHETMQWTTQKDSKQK